MPQIPADHIMVMPGDIKWGESPPGLPPGSQAAVLEGDPRAAGLFTLRAKIPANWKVMPHTHPADEPVTVIEGTCNMGVGNTFDENADRSVCSETLPRSSSSTNISFLPARFFRHELDRTIPV